DLLQAGVAWLDAYKAALSDLVRQFGPRSDWERELAFPDHRERWPHGRPFLDLPILLADSIVGSDRTTLISRALRLGNAPEFRAAISRGPTAPKIKGRPPEQAAGTLGPEVQLQLLLLLSDVELAQLVDDAVEDRAIAIPLGQIRRARTSPTRSGYRDTL